MKKSMTFFLSAIIFLSALLMPANITVNAATFDIDFDTTSKSIYLENLDTNIVVYSKNPTDRVYPASTTKIMTYIITAENVEDFRNTYVTVKKEVLDELYGTNSSVAGIQPNEKLSIYQLLNCLMIPSGNDAAMILADYVGKGDINKFVSMMNNKAKELGCEGTHFLNPHGLSDPNHYTTVTDMAKIAKYALTLPDFADISNTVTSDCLGEDRYLVTTNYMIDPVRGGDYYYDYAQGIKTGSTGNDSGYCLVSTASRNGYTYLCLSYGAPYEDKNGKSYDNGAMLDSKRLYQWAFSNLEIKTVIDKNDLIKEIGLNFAWNKDKIQLAPAKTYSTILPEDVDIASIDKSYNIPESIDAPIKAGDKIGTVTLSYANQKLETIDLVASETVERSELLTAFNAVKSVLFAKWFIGIVIFIILFIIGYIILAAIYNRKKRTQRPVKKYRKF